MTASPSYIMEQKKKTGYTLWRLWGGKMVLELVKSFVLFLYRITHWVVKDHITT